VAEVLQDDTMRSSIETLSNQIKNQPNLSDAEKQELLLLIAEIETETEAVDDGDVGEHPVTVAVRQASEDLKKESFSEQLEASLLKLEASYPKTAAAMGRIGNVLARMGI